MKTYKGLRVRKYDINMKDIITDEKQRKEKAEAEVEMCKPKRNQNLIRNFKLKSDFHIEGES